MGSKWRKAKQALGLNLCYYVPRTADDDSYSPSCETLSDAALIRHRPSASANSSGSLVSCGSTPTVSTSRLRLSKSSSKKSEKLCSICLAAMKPGEGHAIFTAECSHSFHFQCITSNVKHGNQVCPICRATWKEIPLQTPNLDPSLGRSRINPVDDPVRTVIQRYPPSRPNPGRHGVPLSQVTEPAIFDDDECLGLPESGETTASDVPSTASDVPTAACGTNQRIDIKSYPEYSAVERAKSLDDFHVLVHLKAAVMNQLWNSSESEAGSPLVSRSTRTPVDLVTVLDISGSMAGTKLALLKRAMGFVIQNLSSNDRLSVIAFSSTAQRLFPLKKMTETGRQEALQAVNSLVANGGTNIAEGLRKGGKVMEERREKNPVADIILLSDGQDNYTINGSSVGHQAEQNYQLLLPLSIQGGGRSGFHLPVHTFGFGADHDALSMHSISEMSGGTFSFIETEAAIQDAFAQCIGGLLSVVVQELHVQVECVHPHIRLRSMKAGSYPNCLSADCRVGNIDVGDMYADEERDFLVSLNIPPAWPGDKTLLVKVRCMFRDPFSTEMVTLEGEEVKVERPDTVSGEVGSVEVDRQRNRLLAAEAMSQARAAAEQGDLVGAVSILEKCRKSLSETVSAKRQDRLCVALDAELKEMQERMASRHVYESSGRAYILSGLSSHSWQRATARGDSTDISSMIQSYQTPSMTEMVMRSQDLSCPAAQRLLRPGWSSSSPKPR